MHKAKKKRNIWGKRLFLTIPRSSDGKIKCKCLLWVLRKEQGVFPGARRGLSLLTKRKMTVQHLSLSTTCWTKWDSLDGAPWIRCNCLFLNTRPPNQVFKNNEGKDRLANCLKCTKHCALSCEVVFEKHESPHLFLLRRLKHEGGNWLFTRAQAVV